MLVKKTTCDHLKGCLMLRRFVLLSSFILLVTFTAVSLVAAQEPILEPITLDNAEQVEELARFGNGVFTGSLAYSPDGKTLAVAGSIGVWLYNTADFEQTPRLIRRSTAVTRVGFSDNGEYLIYSDSNGVHVTDFESGAGVLFIPRATDFAIHPDSRHLAVSVIKVESTPEYYAAFYHIQIWDIKSKTKLDETLPSDLWINPDYKHIMEMAFASSGETLAIGVSEPVYDICAWHDSEIITLSFDDSQLTKPIAIWGSTLVALDPNSPLLYTAEKDRYQGYTGRLRVWDLEKAEEARIETIEGRAQSIWQAGYSDLIVNPDGSQLAFLRPHVLSLVDSKTLQTTQVIDDWYQMQQIAYHPNGQQLIATRHANLLIWEDTSADPKIIALDDSPGTVNFNADGSGFVINSQDELQLWALDGVTGEKIHSKKQATFREFSGSKVIFETDSVLYVWDLAQRRELLSFEGWTADQSRPFSINTEGSLMAVVSASDNSIIELWDLATLTLQHEIRAENPVIALQFSPDSQRLLGHVSEGDTGVTLILWSLPSGDYSTVLRHNAPQISTVFSRDSQFIFITQSLANERDEAAIAYRWDPDAALKLEVFMGENIGFLEEGSVFYSSTYSTEWPYRIEIVTFRDNETFDELGTIYTSFSGYTTDWSDFSPDEEKLVSLSYTSTNCDVRSMLYVWDVKLYSLIKSSYVNSSSLTFSPNAPLFLMPERGALEVWSLDAGEQVSEIKTAGVRLSAVQFNADGTMILTSSDDGTVRLWGIPAKNNN